LLLALAAIVRPADGALISHWRLDDGAGTVAADDAGGHDGVLSGTATFVPGGMAGGAVSFNQGRIDLPAAVVQALDAGKAFTVSMWISPVSFGGYRTVFDTVGRQLALWIDTPGGGWYGIGGTSNQALYDPAWTTGEWQHLVMTSDGTTAHTYRNGVSNSDLTPGGLAAAEWVLGYNVSGGGNYYYGLMDDVQVYDTALPPADIAFLYEHPGRTLGVVPEPGALALQAAALAGTLRRRRRPR